MMTAEEWRPIPGYEGYYEVSSVGRVRSLSRISTHRNGTRRRVAGRLLKPWVSNQGYPTVSLFREDGRRSVAVHRLVALAFIGPRPEGLEVCHNDGVKTNAKVGNLRYDTRQANIADRRLHGGQPIGSEVPNAKLTEAEARKIIALRGRVPLGVLADRFGVAKSTICRIQKGRRWGHLAESSRRGAA